MICGDVLHINAIRSVRCDLEEGHKSDHSGMEHFPIGSRSIHWPSKRQQMIDDISDLLQGRDSAPRSQRYR